MTMVRFDARWIGEHGIGRFARELAVRVPGLSCWQDGPHPASPLDVLYLSLRLLTAPKALWCSPGFNAPLWLRHRYILTIHDLNHIDFPENSSLPKRFYYQFIMRPACRRAAAVLTVSAFSRQKIIAWAGVAPEQVVNVGNGVAPEYCPQGPVHAPGYPYFLCISNRRPHKNEERLLRAFAQATLPSTVRLCLSGTPTPALTDLLATLGIAARVQFLGRVAEADLPALYRGAQALVFPSLYEGFGLPVLEAMACGTPVITSTTTALPEVAGDAALLVDPLQEGAIAAAMERLFMDDTLSAQLREKGLQRARQFSWEAVAQRVTGVLAGLA